MGLAGGLVRRVFSKSWSSTCARDGNEKHFGAEKSRWSSVRLYICGDEFNSVIAERDLASIRSSEATVIQPSVEASGGEESETVDKEDHEEECDEEEEEGSPTMLFSQETAAIFIQSAFRGFRARQQYEEIRKTTNKDRFKLAIPCEQFEAASTEVHIGGSVENLRVLDECITVRHRVLQKSRSQVHRIKEEWDDSTVSSNVLKLRIQNRCEAMTRRERALAYAFSQQLRICSTKKRSAQCDATEENMGWSWLERWMATRMPENSLVEDCLSKHLEPIGTERRTTILKKISDVAAEEKESCGSNDVSVNFDSFLGPQHDPREGFGPARNRMKATRSVSRRKTVPHYHCAAHPSKVSKRDYQKEAEKERKSSQVQLKGTDEIKCRDGYLVASGH